MVRGYSGARRRCAGTPGSACPRRDPGGRGFRARELKRVPPMSKVLIVTSRQGDRIALGDMLADEGHEVDFADDVHHGAVRAGQVDAIVADLEPTTWAGRALIDRASPALAQPTLIFLCTRIPRGAAPRNVHFLRKPIALEELQAAIGGVDRRGEDEAA